MATFKTADPYRVWTVRLTVGLCDAIKREFALDIGKAITDPDKFIEVLSADAGRMVSVLWIVCEKQAVAAGITPEDFAGLFDGDVLEAAVNALLESVVDFFPKARGREAIKEGLPRVMKRMEMASRKAIQKKLDEILSTSSDSPGSTPELPV